MREITIQELTLLTTSDLRALAFHVKSELLRNKRLADETALRGTLRNIYTVLKRRNLTLE
jgi:hypothetical protein